MIHMVKKMGFHDACMQLCLESNFAFAADQMHEKFNASSVSTFSGLHRLLKVEGMLKTFKNQKNIKEHDATYSKNPVTVGESNPAN